MLKVEKGNAKQLAENPSNVVMQFEELPKYESKFKVREELQFVEQYIDQLLKQGWTTAEAKCYAARHSDRIKTFSKQCPSLWTVLEKPQHLSDMKKLLSRTEQGFISKERAGLELRELSKNYNDSSFEN